MEKIIFDRSIVPVRDCDRLNLEIQQARNFLNELYLLEDGREKEIASMEFLQKLLNEKHFKKCFFTDGAGSIRLLREVCREYRPNSEAIGRKLGGCLSTIALLRHLIGKFRLTRNGQNKLKCYRHGKFWYICTSEHLATRSLGISKESVNRAIRKLKDLGIIETCPGIEYGKRQNRIWLNIKVLTIKLIDAFVEYSREKKRSFLKAIANQEKIKAEIDSVDCDEVLLQDSYGFCDRQPQMISATTASSTQGDLEQELLDTCNRSWKLSLLTVIETISSIYIKYINKYNIYKTDRKNLLTTPSSSSQESSPSKNPQPILKHKYWEQDTFFASASPVWKKQAKGSAMLNNITYPCQNSVNSSMETKKTDGFPNGDAYQTPRYRPQDLGIDPRDPEIAGRAWNSYKGVPRSHARDPWMETNYRVVPQFLSWYGDYKLKKFRQKVTPCDLQIEIRNDAVRSGDLWQEYCVEQVKAQHIARGVPPELINEFDGSIIVYGDKPGQKKRIVGQLQTGEDPEEHRLWEAEVEEKYWNQKVKAEAVQRQQQAELERWRQEQLNLYQANYARKSPLEFSSDRRSDKKIEKAEKNKTSRLEKELRKIKKNYQQLIESGIKTKEELNETIAQNILQKGEEYEQLWQKIWLQD